MRDECILQPKNIAVYQPDEHQISRIPFVFRSARIRMAVEMRMNGISTEDRISEWTIPGRGGTHRRAQG